ncbi:hypothetical protein CEQ90_19695 [Lewinellaceae bacterium SD302]|nr:hypothetical protein CEQ90_19695 [Lewinellaceae bacterium SD302]
MKLDEFTISSIKEFISGDDPSVPYLRGFEIVKLFNDVGVRDIYNRGMPENQSRNEYAFNTLKKINGSRALVDLIQNIFDIRHFRKDEDSDIELAVEKINPLLQIDGYRVLLKDGKYIVDGAEIPEPIEVEIHFEEIQSQIIANLREAEFLIWIAVAWFTDRVLAKELHDAYKRGVNVQIIIADNIINTKYGMKLENSFDFVKRVSSRGSIDYIMHNKFCIIDLKTVIHGSYNWTTKARFNKETISIDRGKSIAEDFAREFINLKK